MEVSRLTEMEVIVLGITKDDHGANDVDKCCILRQLSMLVTWPEAPLSDDIRIPEGLFPKYRALYHPTSPRGFSSGAGPLGSFS